MTEGRETEESEADERENGKRDRERQLQIF